MSAKISALGISVTAVSATKTVRPRASTSDTPITRWACRSCSRAAGLRIDAAAHIRQRHREVAGDSGHHRVGIAERHHAGGEMVTVLVDQALDVALEKAFALEPLVEKGGIGCVTLRKPGVDDLDPAAQLDPQRACALAHAVLPPDE